MAKNRKRTKKAGMQSDREAEEIVSELEDMAIPPKKGGGERVRERAEEVKDAAGRSPIVFGPAGPLTEGRRRPTSGVFGPGAGGSKKVNEEFLEKKAKAEEGGSEPAATPTGFSEPPRPSGGVALPDATKARRRLEGGK